MKIPFKVSKNTFSIISAFIVGIAGVYGILAYKLVAEPSFSKFENDEVAFMYPNWPKTSGSVLKAEDSIRGAGIEVTTDSNDGLPLEYSINKIRENITKDRIVTGEEKNDTSILIVTEFQSGKTMVKLLSKAVSAGSKIYIFSAYSDADKFGKNQKSLMKFLNSVEVKKGTLIERIDLRGTVVKKNNDSEFSVFSDKGEEALLVLTKDTKILDKKGESSLQVIVAGSKFVAEGTFDDKKFKLTATKIFILE